jgi:hypothetical protein
MGTGCRLLTGRLGGPRRHRPDQPRAGGDQLAEHVTGRRAADWVLIEAAVNQRDQWLGKPAHLWFGMKNGERGRGQ